METDIREGAVIDGYRIDAALHAGGMSRIFAVSRDDLPGPAVIKIPFLGHGFSGATIVGFEVEQMILGALNGGVVPILYDNGDVTRVPYLVMERVEGSVLSREVERAPWNIDEVCQTGAAIADAIHDLHEQEVIHLDLKPSNIIIRPDGSAALIDLGLAHHAHLPDLLAEEFRRPLGSAPYIAPEQAMGIRNEPRSDIFALGVMLYEFSTGQLPFGSPKSIGGMRKRLRVMPTPPRALRRDIPAALQEVMLHCLEVDPAHRYASSTQVSFDLRHLDQVAITHRGNLTERASKRTRLKHWFFGMGFEPKPALHPTATLSQAPIVLVAVAFDYTPDQVRQTHQALQREAARLGRTIPGARLAFVTVGKPYPVMGYAEDTRTAPREHLRMLSELRHWAAAVDVDPARTTCHVIEGSDPAEAIIEYARVNRVDHIIGGEPLTDPISRKLLPSVAQKVALNAPCSVTIVRAPRPWAQPNSPAQPAPSQQ